ncbi:hypothetical protein M440DRAFT_1385537 [Trichoderma longibrachiatum ATCC 18648]|uniref:Mid2 domain-containing protein n=1 Tax=Trichoderma longibrachiatum ATCC 18648 TaxID=983965 RepID=A0A2T4BRJ9_TRILO|nr:hypothetical protein M440DRAFT_1385537 [Trichoderma longibrachiatum ATCC 18648]
MAVRIIHLLLAIIHIAHMALCAPTGNISPLPPATISTPSQPPPKQIPGTTPKRHHIIRVSKSANQETSDSNNDFFDTTTLQLLETSPHAKPVPVFTSSNQGKVVIFTIPEDNNGSTITSYRIQDKPIDSTFSSPHAWNGGTARILCRQRLRQCRQRVLEQRLGLLILGASLALAVVCACLRE